MLHSWYVADAGSSFKPDDKLPNLPAPVRMPTDFTFVNRLQWGFGSVLAGLGAEANWRRLVAPWVEGAVFPIPGEVEGAVFPIPGEVARD